MANRADRVYMPGREGRRSVAPLLLALVRDAGALPRGLQAVVLLRVQGGLCGRLRVVPVVGRTLQFMGNQPAQTAQVLAENRPPVFPQRLVCLLRVEGTGAGALNRVHVV